MSKKLRIIVRPWNPVKPPYEVTKDMIRNYLSVHDNKLQNVLYMGWIRRKIDDKKQIIFLCATGKDGREARKRFKYSEAWEQEVWLID